MQDHMEAKIDENVLRFKHDLKRLNPLQMVRRHIVHGACMMIPDDTYYELRECVAEQFETHPNQVLVVGSGKLGFSVAPHKRYRHFCDTSDIDVVISSERFFYKIWKYLYNYKENGGYWERFFDFNQYLFQGWIRPDKLPPDHKCSFAKEWWEFFNKITSSGLYSKYKVSGAIYFNWEFLESYHTRAINNCITALAGDNK